MHTTIAAIATPAGSGAIGIVRLSGENSIDITNSIFQSYNGLNLEGLPGYQGVLGRIVHNGVPVDEVIVFVYRGPKSYTGEDVVEICCHGGLYLVREILRICVECGARPAQPGEFTKRAFLSGKMSLTQAEAVCDLIAARSESARKAAFAARDGALSTAIQRLVENITNQAAYLAAWADYPEEDIEEVSLDILQKNVAESLSEAERLLNTYDRGRLVREGVETAIVGKPNVGKSTLMNLLTGTQRSIVTDIPGTTRDIVQDSIGLGEYVLQLSDTAGIRNTQDIVEKKGVDLALDRIESAELVLAVFDSSALLDQNDLEILRMLENKPCIAVINKVDLPRRLDEVEIRKYVPHVVTLSAQSGAGREQLEQTILTLLQLDTLDTTAAIVANERQRHCLMEACKALREAGEAIESGVTLDAVNVCIDLALDALLSLTGERTTDVVVDEVFARFCVGK